MFAYGGPSRHLRRSLPRRARPYLALSARHGDRALDLYLLSYLPTLVKRVYFRVWDEWRLTRGAGGVIRLTAKACTNQARLWHNRRR